MSYNKDHGSPYDRGSADAYYRRGFKPHYWVFEDGRTRDVLEPQMTQEEIAAYAAGFDEQIESGDFKQWN